MENKIRERMLPAYHEFKRRQEKREAETANESEPHPYGDGKIKRSL